MFRKSWVLALGVVLVSAVSIAQEQIKKGEMSNINTFPDCTLVASNLVANCRFDTGDFTSWIQGGDPTFQSVQPGCGHSGNFCAFMGSVNYIRGPMERTPSHGPLLRPKPAYSSFLHAIFGFGSARGVRRLSPLSSTILPVLSTSPTS
jgi:hypothetical protein